MEGKRGREDEGKGVEGEEGSGTVFELKVLMLKGRR